MFVPPFILVCTVVIRRAQTGLVRLAVWRQSVVTHTHHALHDAGTVDFVWPLQGNLYLSAAAELDDRKLQDGITVQPAELK